MSKRLVRGCVNFDKSTFFFNKNTPNSTRLFIFRELGVRYSNNPKYLGLSNMIDRLKKTFSKVEGPNETKS